MVLDRTKRSAFSLAGERISLPRPVPLYKQLTTDSSCGPRAILIVADYYAPERGRNLFAIEWSRVLEITMKNDLTRNWGTSRKDLLLGLQAVGLRPHKIPGATVEGSRTGLAQALGKGHPVIVWCTITYRGLHYKHYAVLAAMDEANLYFADPFPHADTRKSSLRDVPWEEFKAARWTKGHTTWGRDRWAVEILFGKSALSIHPLK